MCDAYRQHSVCRQFLSDDFDNENGGATGLNYASFANWSVTAGSVDIVASGYDGINCFGGVGSCVNLGGSAHQNGTLTSNSFSFAAGDLVTFSFEMSGDQRTADLDGFSIGLVFGGPTDYANYTVDWGLGPDNLGDYFNIGGTWGLGSLPGSAPFVLRSISFTALTQGSFQAVIGSQGLDDEGPIIDNVSISIGGPATPEPSTWAMMLAGFAGLGAIAHQRSRRAASAL